MLDNVERMIVFVALVDANSPVKHYMRDLKMDIGDFRIHLKFVKYYRTYIQMHNEVAELAKKKRGASVFEKMKINNQIRRLRKQWMPKLAESKRRD